MATFADRLVSLRKERGLVQPDLAKLLGKSRSSIQGYETEGKEPPFETLCFLAEYFGVTTDYLLGRSDSRTNEDTVFANDTRHFSETYAALPNDLRQTVASAFDSFYVLLSRDMKLRCEERLSLYSELLLLLQRSRADIRNRIESSSAVDALFLSDIMAMQSDLKNQVSVLLDRLMQADMGVASSGREKGRESKRVAG